MGHLEVPPDHPATSRSVATFPSEDKRFHQAVVAAFLAEGQATGPEVGERVARRIRSVYRGAVIQLQHPFAQLGGVDVWYAFRDGRVRANNVKLERLYEALSVAQDTARESEQRMEKAGAIAVAAGFSPPRLRSRKSELPEDQS
jgi:hypothetical protein